MKMRERFTKWYVRKGYSFYCDSKFQGVWVCPFWVKPFLALFSPSIYQIEKWGELCVKSFMAGVKAPNLNSIEEQISKLKAEKGGDTNG